MANRDFKVRHGLNVCGNTSLGGDVAISGNLDVGGNISLESADLSGSLQVSGAASFGSLKVAGTASLQGGLVVDTSMDVQTTLKADNISSSGQLQVDGTTSLKNTLTVSGLTSLQGGLVVDTSMDVQTTLNADNISSSGQLQVDGTTSLKSSLTVSGDTQFKGNASVGGKIVVGETTICTSLVEAQNLKTQILQVSGSISSGSLHLAQGLQVSGSVSLGSLKVAGTASLQGDADVNGSLTVSGTGDFDTTLQVSGNASLGSLKVDGTTSLDGALTVSGTASFKGDVAISGALQIGGAGGSGVNIDQEVNLGSTLTVSGATTLCSNLDIGNGRITVCTNTGPHIQLKGNGPNTIRFHDAGSTSTTNALDLVYRATPNTLGFERASDAATIWETDFDDLKTTFHNQVLVSGTICAGSADIAGSLQVSGSASLGSLTVTGNSDINGTLTVCGATTLSSTLEVIGNASFDGTLAVTQSISAPGGIHAVGGDIQTSGTISGTQLHFVSAGGQRMTVSNLDSVSGRVGTLSATTLRWTSAGAQRMTVSSATITSLNVSTITVNQQGNIARRISGTVASTNAGYVTAFTVVGNSLASCVEAFFEGTIANVVVSCYAEIVVNHSGDISIRTHQGQYTPLDVQVISDGSEDFAVLVKRNGGVAGTANLKFNVYPKGDETVTATATNPYSTATFTHTGVEGTKITATGGATHRFETDGPIIGGQTLKVSGLTSLQGGLVVDTSLNVQVTAQMDNISSSGTLTVQGATTLSGAVQAKGTLSVAGSTILSGAVQAKNALQVSGTGTIAGATWANGHLRIGSATAGIAMDPNEIYFSGAGNIGTISGSLTLNPAQSIVTSKVFDSTANIQTTAIISGTQLRCASFAATGTADIAGTLQVSGTASIGVLKVAGTASLQSQVVVNNVLTLKSELDFGGSAQNKVIDMHLLSSNGTAFSGYIRSTDHQQNNTHNHIRFGRGGSVCLYFNNDKKVETTNTGFYVSGTLCTTQDVKAAGQLRAAGAVSVDGSAHVAQNLQVGGTASINALKVAGMTSLQGGVVIDTSFDCQVTLQANTISASGQVIVDQQVQADGSIIAGQTLRAVGNLCAQSNAVINGTGTFRGGVNVSGTLSARKYSFEPYGVIPAYSNNSLETITFNSAESAIELKSGTDTTIGMTFPAWKANGNAGNKWQITMQIRASAVAANGIYIRVYEYDAELPNGKIGVSNQVQNALVQEDTRNKAIVPTYENQPASTTWQTLTFEYTPTSTAVWAAVSILNWSGLGVNALYIREPQINIILENVNIGSNVQVAGHVSADAYGHFGTTLQVSGSASLGSLKVAGTTCLQGQTIAEQLQVHGVTSTLQAIRCAAQSQTNAGGIGGLAIYSSTISWAGISITGPGATKTLGIHYGGQNDNTLRFGRYAKAASIGQVGGYEANPVMFDLDNGNIITQGIVSAAQDVKANGQLRAGLQVCAGGDVRAIGQLRSNAQVSVAGSLIAKQTLQVSGTGSLGSLKVAGVTSLQGGVVIDTSFDCQVTLQANTISASGSVIVDQQVQADGSGFFGQTVRSSTLCAQGNGFVNQNFKVGGTTCLQGAAVINLALQIRSELDFIGAADKYIDFMLVSSNNATKTANFRSNNHNGQAFHTHMQFTRGGAVNLYHNNDLKAATKASGFLVSGIICSSSDIKSQGQLRAAGAISVDGSGHIAQALQVGGAISCASVHATGGVIQTSGIISGGTVTSPTLQYTTRINGTNQNSYDKLRVWNDAAYTIGMNNAMTHGYLNDYAMTFTMNNDADRGFVFRHSSMTKAQAAIAFSVSGRTSIAHGLRVGYGVGFQGDPGTNGVTAAGDVYAGGQVRAAGALSCNGTGHFNGAVQVNGTVSCTALHATGGAIQTSGTISGGTVIAGGNMKGQRICAQTQIIVNQQMITRGNLYVCGGSVLSGTVSLRSSNGTTHWQGTNQRRSAVWRNDGGNYYLLLTGQQNAANTSWNGWRPFYVNLSNGHVNIRRSAIMQSVIMCGSLQVRGKVSAVCGYGGGGADFAEYFEWADGNPNVSDRVGRSVVVTGASGKIGIATDGQTPFGIVTGRAAFVGNTAGNWHKRYLKDEYMRAIKDENGDDVPNPDFNSACTYFTREQRAEWDPIGMMGKLSVRIGEPLNPNWVKLRVVSPTVEEYLVK